MVKGSARRPDPAADLGAGNPGLLPGQHAHRRGGDCPFLRLGGPCRTCWRTVSHDRGRYVPVFRHQTVTITRDVPDTVPAAPSVTRVTRAVTRHRALKRDRF